MKERRKISGLICLLLSVFFVCGVNRSAVGGDSTVEAKDARGSIRDVLARNGLKEGFDSERKAFIVIASHEIDLPDLGQLNESVRLKAMEIAYLRAVSEIGNGVRMCMSAKGQKDMGVSVFMSLHENSTSTMCSNLCVRVMFQAESCQIRNHRIEYMAAIAVVSSEKLSKTMIAAMNGDIDGMPAFNSKSSLKDCVDGIVELNRLGPQIVHDAPKHFWILGTVSQEVDGELDNNALRAKAAYAVEYALGGNINVEEKVWERRSHKGKKVLEENLSNHSYHILIRDSDSNSVLFEKRIKLTPFLRVNPLSEKVKWFERDKENPMTGKKIRIVVAAIDSNDIPSFVRNNSSNVAAESRQETSTSAMEQAQEFLATTELRQGFDEERKVVVQVCSSTFEYEKKMSDEEFARKRYLAFQRALMMGAGGISRMVARNVEVPGNDDRFRSFGWDSSFRLGYFPDDEDDESWISQFIGRMKDQMVGRATDKRFSWKARLVGSEGMARIESPVYGLSILRQFESLSEDRYQVALIVSLDLEKGGKKILAFQDGKVEPPGKKSLRQWMDTQDFGLVVGPRRFVDNEGTIWAIGIVPAAEGQQPYGTMLDAAARECAAFAFGGDLTVSINEGDAENPKRGSFIELNAIGTDWYPRELEQYFRRPYTHPLTGRKGVVAICALRSGTSKIMEEIVLQKIKARQLKQFEKGMRDGMRERVKELARNLDFDSADVDAIKQYRMRKLKVELSKIDVELQHERSMRPEIRKRIEEQLLEISREVIELKGGKGNEDHQ